MKRLEKTLRLVPAVGKRHCCQTSGGYADVFVTNVTNHFRSRTTTFDRYTRQLSINAVTRSTRVGKKKPIHEVINERNVQIPQVWNNVIALDENKADLASVLSENIVTTVDNTQTPTAESHCQYHCCSRPLMGLERERRGRGGMEGRREAGCSLRVCYGDSAFNRREIADFQKRIGHRGATVACYYDPEHVSSGAVLHVIPAGSHVLHALLWPTAASVVGVAACVVFCRWCRRQESASARKTSHVALRTTTTTTTTITLGGPDTPLETTRVVFDDCRTPSCDSTVDQ
ncbi:hypothetical protein NP493_1867g00004 [Ridgeia piscesae]|uniref:Uncharacterized protein n=1 Tax=Ridgeia piscesae TaxID=27915 RepID=A0AAD9N6F1_RIDPI|nr:hypothetical protein NP493_1867g00004 [Ridgeia piscesae]